MKKGLLKTSLVLILIGALCAGMFIGCNSKDKKTDIVSSEIRNKNYNETGLPIVDEKITLTGLAKQRYDVKNFNELDFFKTIEKDTNIHIEWKMIPDESWNEQFSLLMSGQQNIPDIIYGTWSVDGSDVSKYGDQGIFIALNDYIENDSEYLNKILNKHPEYLASVTSSDGNVYGLPGFSADLTTASNTAGMINIDWLKKVNKEMPTTLEELKDVLRAFKEGGDLNDNGINDEVPYAFIYNNGNCGQYALYKGFGVQDTVSHLIANEDKVICSAVTDEYKEATKWFHSLVKEELIDVESFVYTFADYTAKVKTKSIGYFPGWSRTWAFGTDKNTGYEWTPVLTGPNGDKAVYYKKYSTVTGPSFFITKNCKHIKEAFRWADYLYQDDFAIQAYAGMYGTSINKLDDGTIEYAPIREDISFDELRQSKSPGVNSLFAVTPELYSKVKLSGDRLEKREIESVYTKEADASMYQIPGLNYTGEEAEERALLSKEIVDYINSSTARWIMEGGIDEEWDKYKSKLKDMGLDRYIQIEQTALDRFIGNIK